MAMVLKRKKLTINEGMKIIQDMEENPTMLCNEIAECFVLPSSSLSNKILWNFSILEEEIWCGAHTVK
jgi:hypothetical protein